MGPRIMYILNNAIISVSNWYGDVMAESGVLGIYLSCIFVYFAIKFLLSPVLGVSMGSDQARSLNSRNTKSKSFTIYRGD